MPKRVVILEHNKIVIKEYSLDREPKEGESLLKILYCGICGSDVHVFKGKHPFVEFPVSTGHEVIGVVEKSDLFKKGQYVAIRPSVWDNECYYCKHGMPHICEKLKVRGFQEEGLLAEKVIIPNEAIFPIDPKSNEVEAFTLTEPLSTSVHAAKLTCLAGKKVAVVGLGTIGILTAAVSKVYGAKEVIGFDVNSWKVQKAKEFNFVSNALSPQENNSYMDFDVVFEAVGIQSSIDTAFNLVRKRGTIIIIGVFAGPGTVPLHLIQDREFIIKGALMYTDDDFSESVNLISQKRINTQALISKIFDGIDHVPDAFQYASNEKNSFKTLIKL
jgi:L-iditol 2-dehydrogenase